MLSNRRLKSIDESIFNCKNLKVLELDKNLLTSLPSKLASLKKINTLSCRNNRLEKFPEVICTLSKLRSLDIRTNFFEHYPASFGKLAFLHTFNGQPYPVNEYLRKLKTQSTPPTDIVISDMHMVALPFKLFTFANTEFLDASSNLLHELPDELGTLELLRKLDLFDNKLACLPDGFGQLTHLVDLDLSGNEITDFPLVLTSLDGLERLDLSNNALETLPHESGDFLMLSEFDLSLNPLQGLPTGFEQLKSLRELHLNHCASVEWESSLKVLASLPLLQRLYMTNCGLRTLSPEVGGLAHLLELDLSYNSLTSLPAEITRLTGLKRLVVRGNDMDKPTHDLLNFWASAVGCSVVW